MLLIYIFFFLVSTVKGWHVIVIIFLKRETPSLCLANNNLARNVKPGLQSAFAQTWSSLSRALFPYASALDAGPGLSTFNSF